MMYLEIQKWMTRNEREVAIIISSFAPTIFTSLASMTGECGCRKKSNT